MLLMPSVFMSQFFVVQHLHGEDLAFLTKRGSSLHANGRNKPAILWADGRCITPGQARSMLCAQSFKVGIFRDRPTATQIEGYLQSLWMHLKVTL